MRPIDADALLENLDKECGDLDLEYNSEYEQLVNYIESQPTLDYAPVVHASWIPQDDTYTKFQCSLCKTKNFDRQWVFCPLCGARMDGEK